MIVVWGMWFSIQNRWIFLEDLRNRILNNDAGRTLSFNGYGLAFARLVWRASAYGTSEKATQRMLFGKFISLKHVVWLVTNRSMKRLFLLLWICRSSVLSFPSFFGMSDYLLDWLSIFCLSSDIFSPDEPRSSYRLYDSLFACHSESTFDSFLLWIWMVLLHPVCALSMKWRYWFLGVDGNGVQLALDWLASSGSLNLGVLCERMFLSVNPVL